MSNQHMFMLSGYQLSALVYSPLGEHSPLKMAAKIDSSAVQDQQFILFCQAVLRDILAQQPLKLTAKGNLSRKFVHQTYDHRFYPSEDYDDGTIKINKEEDFWELHLAHILLKAGGMVRKYKGKISVTKKGEQIMTDAGALYLALLKTFIEKFNWSYFSYFEDEIGQFGWGFIMLHLIIFGEEERPISYYADAYLSFQPDQMRHIPQNNPHVNPQERFNSNIEGKFFKRLCKSFKLVDFTTEKGKYGFDEIIGVKKTALADMVFSVTV